MPEYAAVVREQADRFGAVLGDHHRVRTEAGDRTEYWISEGCHPNEYGHRMLALELCRTLGIDAHESSLSRSYLP